MDPMASMTMAISSTSTASAGMSTSSSGMSSMPGMDMGMGMDMSCKISMLWNWETIDACFLSSAWHITSRGMFAGSCIGVICLVLCLEFLRRVGREYDAFILRRARLRKMYMSDSSSGTSAQAKTNNRNYQTVASGEESSSKTTDCDRCCKVPPYPSVQDDLITPAPDASSDGKPSNQSQITAAATDTAASLAQGIARRQDTDSVVLESYRPSPVEQVIRALLHMLQFAVAYFIMLLAMYFNGYIIICIFIGAFLGSLIFSWEPVSLNKENDATQVTKCCG